MLTIDLLLALMNDGLNRKRRLFFVKNKYDVVIIGGGIGGIMTAYRLVENDPSLQVARCV